MDASFQRLNNALTLPRKFHKGVIAIGNFDGVHKGHQAVLQKALERAKEKNAPALVLTFEPHPRSYFAKTSAPYRLTSAAQKAEIFEKMGFQAVIEQKFDKDFSTLSREDFLNMYLLNQLKIDSIVIGEDFCFGADRMGNIPFLKQEAENKPFDVYVVKKIKDTADRFISSTLIRKMLHQGAVNQAAKALGYRYRYQGKIVHGQKLGRKLGYPTANIHYAKEQGLAYGVYAIKLHRAKCCKPYYGVASLGVRPTVSNENIPFLESYIYDFNEDLYGEDVTISFFAYLRGEEKFENLEILTAKIKEDVMNARNFLRHAFPLSFLDAQLNF